VEVLTYCVMSNHIHLLVRADRSQVEDIADEELLKRIAVLYSGDRVALVEKTLKKYRKNHAVKAARELREQYLYRMGDISEFMKGVKQKFSRWYNKANARVGTLWESRYSVTMVGEGWATKVVAAYIDLNPLRAGMVSDPADYKWSGYAQAVAKAGTARDRLFAVMQSTDYGASQGASAAANVKEAIAQYRVLLAEEGGAQDVESAPLPGQKRSTTQKRKKGFSKQAAKAIIDRGGKLSMSQLLRCKARYFSDGFAVGSKDFVEGVLSKIQEKTEHLAGRKSAPSKLKHGDVLAGVADGGGLYSFRKLQKDPVTLE